MEILNRTSFTFSPLVGQVNYPEHSITLIVKSVFDLHNNDVAKMSEKQLYPTGDEFYPEDDSQKNIRYESDFAHFKPKADLLLVGKCYTPKGNPQKSCTITFQVGNKQSSLAVYGNRYWLPGVKTFSPPEPFTVMDISYKNSFGGEGYEKNPIGKGYRKHHNSNREGKYPLPNIENIHQLINSSNNCPEPAGFGPLSRIWQHRFSLMGTYSGNWLKERWPWFAADFNWEHSNAASEQMQVSDYLRGDEALIFKNLHPEIPVYQSQLPKLRVRCFLSRRNPKQQRKLEFSEVSMNLDTLWVDMNSEKLILVWRGVNQISAKDHDEIKHLYIVSEQLNTPPRTTEEYHQEFKEILAEKDTHFEEEIPDDINSKSSVAIEETIKKAEMETEQALKDIDKELTETGIASLKEIPELSAEDKAMEAYLMAEYGLDLINTQEAQTRVSIIRRLRNNESFAEEDFSNLDLSDLDLRGGNFKGAIFSGVNLKNTLFDNAILIEANFAEADLSGASLQKADASDADFTEAHLNGANLSESFLMDSIFEKALLTNAILNNVQSSKGYFSGADLSNASLQGGKFDGADFSNTILNNTNFHQASLKEATLEGARGDRLLMSESDLTELRASGGCSFIKANFRKVQAKDSTWENAELTGSDFSYSDMEAADFSSAQLKQVNFLAADLKQAKFVKANLTLANCVTMNLFEASFENAILFQTDLSGSNLYGAEFFGAKLKGTILQSANLKRTKLAEK